MELCEMPININIYTHLYKFIYIYICVYDLCMYVCVYIFIYMRGEESSVTPIRCGLEEGRNVGMLSLTLILTAYSQSKV
jgi:hypothetical protein